jgi:hypothetical protein
MKCSQDKKKDRGKIRFSSASSKRSSFTIDFSVYLCSDDFRYGRNVRKTVGLLYSRGTANRREKREDRINHDESRT